MIVPNPIPTKSLNNIKDMNSEIIKNESDNKKAKKIYHTFFSFFCCIVYFIFSLMRNF